jgi:hypothetical protein
MSQIVGTHGLWVRFNKRSWRSNRVIRNRWGVASHVAKLSPVLRNEATKFFAISERLHRLGPMRSNFGLPGSILRSVFPQTGLQPMLPSSSALVLVWSKVRRPRFVQPGCTGRFLHPACTTHNTDARRRWVRRRHCRRSRVRTGTVTRSKGSQYSSPLTRSQKHCA